MSAYSDLISGDGPSLYWRLGSGGLTDQSGNGRDGTANGGLTVGGVAGALTGDADAATDFDGSGKTATIAGYTPAVNGTVRTFEAWVWRDNTAATHGIMGAESAWTWGWSLPSGSSNVVFNPNGVGANTTWMAAFPGTAQWVLLDLIFDETANTGELFVNGVSAGAQAVAGAWSGSGFTVGAEQSTNRPFDGKIDEVAIYEGALTSAQILEHYEMGVDGPPPAPPAVIPSPTVRERPPLRLHLNLTTPYGQTFRWGQDEAKPANVPAGLTFGSIMPGGFDSLSCTLPRKPEQNYADLGRLSTLTAYGPGRQVAWQGRLESAPRVSGDQMSVAPGAVGWQAHLDDDTSASAVFVDRDLNSWGEMSRARRIVVISAASASDGAISPDPSNGIPGVQLEFDGNASTTPQICERLYDAGTGNYIESIYYDFVRGANTTSSYSALVRTGASDTSFTTDTANLCLSASSLGTLTAGTSHRYSALYFQSPAGDGGTDGLTHDVTQRRLAVFGYVSISKKGTAPDQGFYAADVIAYVLGRWCPLLTYSTGANGSISDTSFVIPHLVFKETTTPGAMVSAANRFHLRDWAVWENPSGGKPLFYYHDRGARGKTWRARVAPAKLEEAGASTTNLYNGVVVSFQDVDGTTKTVGPTGSGANTTSASVTDTDPLNPANQLGIRRWAQLSMNGVSTAAGATEVGRRFLVEAAQYNTSGRAQLVGHVEDDRGVIYPAWRVRAGDVISFVDASLTDPRRVVRTQYDDRTKTCSVDLDSPAEGLEALLNRLQVSLVGIL